MTGWAQGGTAKVMARSLVRTRTHQGAPNLEGPGAQEPQGLKGPSRAGSGVCRHVASAQGAGPEGWGQHLGEALSPRCWAPRASGSFLGLIPGDSPEPCSVSRAAGQRLCGAAPATGGIRSKHLPFPHLLAPPSCGHTQQECHGRFAGRGQQRAPQPGPGACSGDTPLQLRGRVRTQNEKWGKTNIPEGLLHRGEMGPRGSGTPAHHGEAALAGRSLIEKLSGGDGLHAWRRP